MKYQIDYIQVKNVRLFNTVTTVWSGKKEYITLKKLQQKFFKHELWVTT